MKKTVAVVDGNANKVVARITWDGKKVECDDEKFFAYLKRELGSASGEHFLDRVLARYKSGYMHAYRIGD